MTANIRFIPSQKLSFLNTTDVNLLVQELEPKSRRFDDLEPSSSQINQDGFLAQQPKPYLNLRLLKTDRYQVGMFQNLPDGTGTSPTMINPYNWWFDPFCQSKAINQISIKFGYSELKETQELRDPFLIELKSAMFDLEECKRFGQVPIETDGLGHFGLNVSSGPIPRQAYVTTTDANKAGLYDLANPTVAEDSEMCKIVRQLRNPKRVRNLNDETLAPSFWDAPGGNAYTATWCPDIQAWIPTDASKAASTTYFTGLNKTGTGIKVATGTVYAEYIFEVKEYLIASFLSTPYSKNKTERMIKILPNNFVNFNFQYNTDYIQNGMFKWATDGTTYSSSNLYCNVTRIPSASRLLVETLDVASPPRNNFNLSFMYYKPHKIESAQILGMKTNGSETRTIKALSQDRQILPQYLFLGADPQLWNGNQIGSVSVPNKGLVPGQSAFFNCSTFQPCNITRCKIQIGQVTITENISLDEMKRMTNELLNNPDLSENILGYREMISYFKSGPYWLRSGCPFLLLDISKLNMESSTLIQMLPNILYPPLQTISIEYDVVSQAMNYPNQNIGTQTLDYASYVYALYPYGVYQKAGEQVEELEIVGSLDEGQRAITADYSGSTSVDLNLMNGGGFFDDAKDWVKENSKDILKALMSGVRLGEKMLEGTEYEGARRALQGLDHFAFQYGYGKKRGGRKGGAMI